MSSKIVVIAVFLVLSALLIQNAASQRCPRNQEYTQCGTACPPRCGVDNENRPCTLQCVIGCQCRQGLLLNNRGDCVRPNQC